MAELEETQRARIAIQRARLEKAERFLRTARLALREGDHETSVSRAYYSVFHGIHALLGAAETIGRHETAIDAGVQWNRRYTRLNALGFLDNQHRDLKKSLDELYRWRNEADYQLGATDRRRAQRAVDFARRMLEAVRGIIT